jgi:hypothetical protein
VIVEKRTFRRVTLPDDIVVNDDLCARDLSENGLLLESVYAFSVGRRLALVIDLGGYRIDVVGTVRWSSVSAAVFSRQNLCGVQFTSLKPSDLNAMRRYILQLVET